MKFHNLFDVAVRQDSVILPLSIAITFITLFIVLVFTLGKISLVVIPIAAIIRVIYALLKGK